VLIRPRTDADVSSCERLAREVHSRDGYPAYLPGDDLVAFLVTPGALRAWVAEGPDGVAGHVALHPRSSAAVMASASERLGAPPERLAVVARLLVGPGARGQGIGRLLLETASYDAVARGLWPVLDVAKDLRSAIALYESCGWVRVGEVTVRLPDGRDLEEFVYVAPPTVIGEAPSVG
jgi:ribosomal protein S18 acetylase RimI-like enzyme